MIRLVHSIPVVTLALVSSSALAQRRDFNTVRKSVLTALEAKARAAQIPGMTAAIVFPTTAVQEFGLGYSDTEVFKAIQTKDRFLAGSVGKTFFAAVALQLVQEKKLSLDAKLSTVVGQETWFKGLPNAADLTLRHLLQHTSGIPDHVHDLEFLNALRREPLKSYVHPELLQWTQGKQALHPAGEKVSYADTNYIIVGLVIEKVTGKPAYTAIQERIFRRFGIKDTLPSNKPNIDRLVHGHHMQPSPLGMPAKMVVNGQLVVNPQFEWGGGGFASTSLDLARWFDHLGRKHVYSQAMWNEATKAMPMGGRGTVGYGLGLMVRPTPYGNAIGHDGWFPGYLTSVAYFPEENTTIAVMLASDDSRKMKLGSWDLLMVVAAEAMPKRN